MQTQKEMIKEAMQAIAARKPGRSKLVYDKTKRTIVAVSVADQTRTGLNITAEDADMFSEGLITITSEFLDDNWQKLLANSILPIPLSEWDGGEAYTLASIGVAPSQKVIFAAAILEGTTVSDFPIVVRLRRLSDNTGQYGYQSPEGTPYAVTAEVLVNDLAKKVQVEIVGLAESLSSRRQGIIETDLLKDSSVVIVGLGTGGIQVALELAKTGVGKFKLVDPDRLEIGNVSRHQAGISSVGRKKVAAARDLVLEKNPEANVEVHPILAGYDNKGLLTSLIETADITICATDSRHSKLLINSLCVEAKKTVIIGGAFRRAYGGQVLRVRPGESACFHCFVLAMPDREADQEISSEENAAAIAYSDKPVPIEPGLAMDVAPIGTMISKLALQELITGKESTLHILDKDFVANWYFWINRPEPNTDYASFPPLSASSSEMTILRWYGVDLEKDQGCPTCGDFGRTLREQYGLGLETISPPVHRSSLPEAKK